MQCNFVNLFARLYRCQSIFDRSSVSGAEEKGQNGASRTAQRQMRSTQFLLSYEQRLPQDLIGLTRNIQRFRGKGPDGFQAKSRSCYT